MDSDVARVAGTDARFLLRLTSKNLDVVLVSVVEIPSESLCFFRVLRPFEAVSA